MIVWAFLFSIVPTPSPAKPGGQIDGAANGLLSTQPTYVPYVTSMWLAIRCVLRELRVSSSSAQSVLSCARSEDPVNHRASIHRLALVVAFALLFAPLLIRAQEQAQSAAPPKPAASAAADPKTPRPITLDDYPRFKRLANQAISTDGKWMLYTVTPNEGDGTLFVKSLDTTTSYEIPRGTNASFSDNARWVAYFIPPPTATGRGARGGRGTGGGRGDAPAPGEGAAAQAPPRAFEVLDLTTGTKTQYPAVEAFVFAGR